MYVVGKQHPDPSLQNFPDSCLIRSSKTRFSSNPETKSISNLSEGRRRLFFCGCFEGLFLVNHPSGRADMTIVGARMGRSKPILFEIAQLEQVSPMGTLDITHGKV